ncbi:MAG TPA: methyltransferase domain-containing protein [Anaerolineae bacterium]|nr:methyltransferase domain-containing protein [Anaerolineae bacterium]HQH38544.1 methyltransferase domain-containing protein [Anaerolineae bacterium]
MQFDAYYYAHDCGRPYQRDEVWLSFFAQIAEYIDADPHPQTVLDAGCAMGFLVEKLRERGIEAYGIDISEYAIQQVHESVRSFCQVGSITAPFSRHYDLIVSLEVLEHLPPIQAREAIANFCQHTDQVLFSSTPLDYREVTHVNVQPPEYWAELFARHGFIRDLDYDASFLTPWAGLFRRTTLSVPQLVHGFERRCWLLQHETSELRAALVETHAALKHHEQETSTLRQEVQRLEDLVAGFRNGRLMRLLFAIQNWRRKIR